jgi:NAD(P)-dependent dehydrogenase (short-subunit alcohol dehydrogenase family)
MPERLDDLTGRVAIVTGGGTGIGAATTRLLARSGADVAIAARTEVVRLVQRTIDELGRIDILVNNAGGTRMRPLADVSTRAWDKSFDLNVRAAYLCTRDRSVRSTPGRSRTSTRKPSPRASRCAGRAHLTRWPT